VMPSSRNNSTRGSTADIAERARAALPASLTHHLDWKRDTEDPLLWAPG
jgi:hypothetical protein